MIRMALLFIAMRYKIYQCYTNIGVKSASRVIRVEYTLATLALAMALIWVKTARDNCIKVGNILSNPKNSCKSKWFPKYNGILGHHLKTTNKMV